MNAAKPRNIPAPPPRKFDHGLTMAQMAALEMERPENRALTQGVGGDPEPSRMANNVLALVPSSGDIKARDIAEKLKAHPDTVRHMLTRLEKRGLVRKRAVTPGRQFVWSRA